MHILLFIPVFLFVLPSLISWVVWKQRRKKDPAFGKLYLIFYCFWFILFAFILLLEYAMYGFEDQMITSSGDSTYRQHWISILIGYALIITLYVLAELTIRSTRKSKILIGFVLWIVSVGIFFKNQHAIVYGSNGSRFVEIYTPFYHHESIGCLADDFNPITNSLGYPYTNKNISKIFTRGNEIIFVRPHTTDYKISKTVLFWTFDFPDEFK